MAQLASRMVPDPMITDAEFYHQQSREFVNSDKRGRRVNTNVGKVEVQENITTRIGGLAFVKSRLDHHERAAERFKNQYESMFGSGGAATDASRVQVDTSKMAHDSGMAAKVDKGRDLYSAIQALGKDSSGLLIAVVVLGIPIKGIAPNPHWRACKSVTGELLNVLDCLATRWGYLSPLP